MMENSNVAKIEKPKKRRIWEIDFLRGLSIFLLIFDHTFCALYTFGDIWFGKAMLIDPAVAKYSLLKMIKVMSSGELLGGQSFALRLCYFSKWWWDCGFRAVAQPLFATLFIVICGISCTLSRNNLKRGLLLLGIAELLTLGSHLFMSPEYLNFGVLHLLAVCILVFEGISAIFKGDQKKVAVTTACLCVLTMTLFAILRYNLAFLKSFGVNTNVFKNVLFCTKYSAHYSKGIFFNNAAYFSPTDFFPILPWMPVFMFGATIGKLFYNDKKSLLPSLDKKWNEPLCFMGRYTIWFYLGQPVVVYGILMLVSYFKMTPNSFGII